MHRRAYGLNRAGKRIFWQEGAQMPKRQETAITKRTVEALSVDGHDAVFWDRDLPDFGIRVYPSDLKK